jgi:hypothetical protein
VAATATADPKATSERQHFEGFNFDDIAQWMREPFLPQ